MNRHCEVQSEVINSEFEMTNKIFLWLLCSFSLVNSQFSTFTEPFLTFYSTGGSNRPTNQQYTSYQPSVGNRETFSQPQSYQPSPSGCNQYFSYQSDNNGYYGLVSLPIPSGVSQIHMKVKLALAARISSVRTLIFELLRNKIGEIPSKITIT